MAIVPVAYLCARDLLDRRAGLLAAAFMVVNPFMIWYSQEARSYMLVALFSGLSFLWFIRARREPSTRNLAWWAVFSAAALMTHFFAGFVVAPEAVWLLWVARKRATVIAVGAVAAVQIAMLPFAVAGTATSRGAGWIGSISRTTRIAQTVIEWGASNLYRRTTTLEGLIAGAGLLVIVVLLLGPGADRRTRQAAKVALVVAGCASCCRSASGCWARTTSSRATRSRPPCRSPRCWPPPAAPRERGSPARRWRSRCWPCSASPRSTSRRIRICSVPIGATVARALGPGDLPRAILAADGTTADALKIYLPGVSWTQVPGRRVLIREVDVVGATKKLHLRR